MSKFNIVKKVSLAGLLGDGHEASYLTFKPMTFKDARELEALQSTEDFTPQIPDGSTPAQVKKITAEAKGRENKVALDSVDKAIAFMKSKFIDGNIAGTAVAAEDFDNDELGVEVINYCMAQLAGAKTEDFTKA